MKPRILFAGVGLLFCTSPEAATYYVATNGSDSHSATQAQNPSTAKLTIAAGIGCLSSGDTLVVKAGTYTAEISNIPAGSDGAYTVVMGESGNRPKITRLGEYGRGVHLVRGSADHHIEVRGFEFDTPYDGVKIEGDDASGYPHHFRFTDNIVHHTQGTGMLISSNEAGILGGDHLIKGNEFHHIGIGNPGYQPGMNTIYNPGNRTVIENNTFHDVTHGIAIYLGGCKIYDVIIRNNLFYNIYRSDIDTWQQGATGGSAFGVAVPGGRHRFYNNVIYDICPSIDDPNCSGISAYYGADDVKIFNNTIYGIRNSVSPGIDVDADAYNVVVQNNIVSGSQISVSGASNSSSHNLTNNPGFVNAAAGDFHLLSNSPARNAGVNLYSQGVTTDYAGTARSASGNFDIGAYQYAGTIISNNHSSLAPAISPITIRSTSTGVMISARKANAAIYTLNGQKVGLVNGSNGIEWKPNTARTGVYLSKVKSENSVQSAKVFCRK